MSTVLVHIEVIKAGAESREVSEYFSRVPCINEHISLSVDDGPYQVVYVYHHPWPYWSGVNEPRATITVVQ